MAAGPPTDAATRLFGSRYALARLPYSAAAHPDPAFRRLHGRAGPGWAILTASPPRTQFEPALLLPSKWRRLCPIRCGGHCYYGNSVPATGAPQRGAKRFQRAPLSLPGPQVMTRLGWGARRPPPFSAGTWPGAAGSVRGVTAAS